MILRSTAATTTSTPTTPRWSPPDLRVVPRVVQHHRVRRGQVDAHAARARRDQVEEGLRGGRVERAHVHLARDAVGRAVEPEEGRAQRAPPRSRVLLEHVERQRVLREVIT